MGEGGQEKVLAFETMAQAFLQAPYRQWNLSLIRSDSPRSEPS